MDYEILEYNYKGKLVRCYIDKYDDPWFKLYDICGILGLKNTTLIVNRLENRYIRKIKDNYLTEDDPNRDVFINEINLYKTILRSRKDESEELLNWIHLEVMTDIRDKTLIKRNTLLNKLIDKVNKLEKEIETLKANNKIGGK